MTVRTPDTRQWRPQTFGRRSARAIESPVIEPLWSGLRVIAHVTDAEIELWDADGSRIERPEVEAAVLAATAADSAVFDGYLSPEAARSGVGVYSGPTPAMPTPGDMARQMIVGGRNRRKELVEELEARAEAAFAPEEPVAFVAVDLLLVDGEPLLDVPLMERKRLLDGVLAERELARIGIHVRPPVDPWLGTWRNVGFRMLAYKDPNGRYRPGEPNEGWATATIPRS